MMGIYQLVAVHHRQSFLMFIQFDTYPSIEPQFAMVVK